MALEVRHTVEVGGGRVPLKRFEIGILEASREL